MAKTRRTFTPRFKAQAVKLVTEQGRSLAEVEARYGSPRIHAELVARGEPCCVNAVARLMHQEGIAAETRREFRVTTDSNHDRPVAEDVLDRQFETEAPDQA